MRCEISVVSSVCSVWIVVCVCVVLTRAKHNLGKKVVRPLGQVPAQSGPSAREPRERLSCKQGSFFYTPLATPSPSTPNGS